MKIFYLRYTCIIISAFLAGCLLACNLTSSAKIVSFVVFSSLSLISIIINKLAKGKVKIVYSKKRAALTAASLLMVALSMVCAMISIDLPLVKIKDHYGLKNEYVFEVTDVTMSERFACEFEAKIIKRGAETVSPSPAVLVSLEYGLYPERGDIISCNAVVNEISSYVDNKSNFSEGIFLVCFYMEDAEVISHSSLLAYKLLDIRDSISSYITNNISGQSGELYTSLLTGDRSGLSLSANRDFKRLGITHILSLSGLHLSIIAFGIEFVLRKAYVPKNIRFAVELVFAIAYVGVTGFTLPMIRSAVMLASVAFTFYFQTDNDPMTALFIAAGGICFFTPYSIISITFLLSFLATFGILAYNEFLEIRERNMTKLQRHRTEFAPKYKKILWRIRDSFMIGLFATEMTFLITACFFDSFSGFAPVFNLFLAPLFSLYIYLCCIAIPFLYFEPVASVCNFFGGCLLKLIGNISNIDGLLFSSINPIIIIGICLSTLLIIYMLVANLRTTKRIISVMIAAFVILSMTMITEKLILFKDDSITYMRSDNNEQIVIKDGGDVLVCDLTNGRNSAVYELSGRLSDESITEIDTYVLTHYHSAHVNSVGKLVGSIKINRLLLPIPNSKDDESIYYNIISKVESEGVDCELYEIGDLINEGDISMNVLLCNDNAFGNHKSFVIDFNISEQRVLYITDSISSANTSVTDAISKSEHIFFGTHGTAQNSIIRLPIDCYSENLKTVAAANDNLVLYAPNTGIYLKEAKFITLKSRFKINF